MTDSIDDVEAAHMFAVRIDRDGDGEAYVFRVEPHTGSIEMIAIDSTPGIIAFVLADNPGAAAQSAWVKGEIEGQALAKLGGMKALLTKDERRAAESKTASPEPQAEHWQIAMAKGWAKLREQKRAIRAEAWELGHNATGPYAENPYAAEPQAAEPPELKPTKADLIATGRVVVLNRAATNIQHGDASTALDELERRIK